MQLESSVTLFDDDKVETRFAELQITADGITSEVSKKVGNDEVISRINQSAEGIQIQANKVNIEGATIFTDGRLSQNSLDSAYDANGSATSEVSNLKSDLSSSSGTTVINGGHIETGTLNAGAVNANSGKFNTANIPNLSANKITADTINIARIPATARNDTYITDIGSDGIRVHDSHTPNNSIVIKSNGMEVFKGGTAAANSVAFYGDTARVGKQGGSHVLTSANQFGMFNSTDEPYFSVTDTGVARSNEYWQGAVIASGATGTLGRFPLKNTGSTVQIRVEDDNGESTVLAGSALSNANVRTNNYAVTLAVSGNEVSGNVVVTCTNSSSSPYVTIKCKNNLGASAKIFMVYTRTIDIPELNFAGDNKLLWSGMKQMSDIDYIHLNESVSQQLSGIALVWAKSDYSAPNVQYVPKSLVRLRSTPTQGVAVNTIVVQSGFSNIGTKTVYVSDYEIEGHSANAQTSGSGSSISPNHSGSWYLIYVFGV